MDGNVTISSEAGTPGKTEDVCDNDCAFRKVECQCQLVRRFDMNRAKFKENEERMKLLEEETSISFNYMKEEIQLPAFAICQFHDSNLTDQSNMNFQEFMKDTFSIKDLIINGYFEYGTTLPDEKL